MGDSIELIDLFSGVTTSRDSNGCTMKLTRGCLTVFTLSHWVIRPSPVYGVKVVHFAQTT